MAQNDVRAAGVVDHERSDFAGKCAFSFFSRTVLRGNFDIRSFQAISQAFQRGKDRRDDNLTVVCVRDQRLQSQCRRHRVGDGLVHLPVSSDDRFAHELVHL